ncbi:hypothetical protein [Phreatobacter sp.]|uniref:hypothetical protein n=1 Tax=Phreatobacter sp. TaxID=1966341 RepID=UPI0025D9B153|nr:hypothetical protein [Phreatobacter sp.]
MRHNLDDPAVRRKLVGALLKLSPIMFVGCWILGTLQGAGAIEATVIAGVIAAMCLAGALGLHLFGSSARYILLAITGVLGLLAFLVR